MTIAIRDAEIHVVTLAKIHVVIHATRNVFQIVMMRAQDVSHHAPIHVTIYVRENVALMNEKQNVLKIAVQLVIKIEKMTVQVLV